MGYIGMILEHSGVSSAGMYWDGTGVNWNILEGHRVALKCSRMALRCTGVNWGVLGCPGMALGHS